MDLQIDARIQDFKKLSSGAEEEMTDRFPLAAPFGIPESSQGKQERRKWPCQSKSFHAKVCFWSTTMAFTVLVLTGMIFSLIFHVQWESALNSLQTVCWNTNETYSFYMPSASTTRQKRTTDYEPNLTHISITHLPMGTYLEPHTKPVIARQQVVGLPCLLHFDSVQLSQQHHLMSKVSQKRLVTTLEEELMGLKQNQVDYELPLGGPEQQLSYQSMLCYASLGHCFWLDFGTERLWPTKEIIADHCNRPTSGEDLAENAYPQWYLNVDSSEYGYVKGGRFENAKVHEYRIPGGQRSARSAFFCTTDLYSAWWAPDSQFDGGQKQQAQKLKECLLDESTGKLADVCLPATWNDHGKGHFFRDLTSTDFCQQPRFPSFLNRTYFEHSCSQDWCEKLPMSNCSWPPEGLDWKCNYCSWNISEVGWSPKEGQQAMLGPLRFLGQLSGPWCVKQREITTTNYTAYSLMHVCTTQAKMFPVDHVIAAIRKILTVPQEVQDFPCDQNQSHCTEQSIPDMPFREAIWVNNDTFTDFFTLHQNEIEVLSRRSKREALEWKSRQNVGLLLTGAAKTISRLSDANDIELKNGIILLRDYLVTSFGVTLHDLEHLSDALTIETIHLHLSESLSLLRQRIVPWAMLNLTEIQQSLRLTEKLMRIVSHSAKATVYKMVKHRDESSRKARPFLSTRWTIYLYVELQIPGKIYSPTWQVKSVGYIVPTGKYLSLSYVLHPYDLVALDSGEQKFLKTVNCADFGYLFCEEIIEESPCGTQETESDCPVTLQPVKSSYLDIQPLRNGSYVILSSSSDCGVPANIPSLVTVNNSVECYGQILQPPVDLVSIQTVNFEVPPITLQFPLLSGVIANLRRMKINLFSTHNKVQYILEIVQQEMLRLERSRNHWAETWSLLQEALEQTGAHVSTFIKVVGQVITELHDKVVVNAINVWSYISPLLTFLMFLISVLLYVKFCRD